MRSASKRLHFALLNLNLNVDLGTLNVDRNGLRVGLRGLRGRRVGLRDSLHIGLRGGLHGLQIVVVLDCHGL